MVVLNEQAAEELNFGNDLSAAKLDGQYEVAGVLKDFNYTSLQNKIGPLCLFITTDVDSTAKWTKTAAAFSCAFIRKPASRLC